MEMVVPRNTISTGLVCLDNAVGILVGMDVLTFMIMIAVLL